jgi:hypothetical protein
MVLSSIHHLYEYTWLITFYIVLSFVEMEAAVSFLILSMAVISLELLVFPSTGASACHIRR